MSIRDNLYSDKVKKIENSLVENIIDTSFTSGFIRASGTYSDNCATMTRNVATGGTYYFKDYENLKVGKEYITSADFVTSDEKGCYVVAMYVYIDESGTQSFESIGQQTIFEKQGHLSYKFTPIKESARIRIAYQIINTSAINGTTATFSNMQLEESAIEHPYVSSTSVKLKVSDIVDNLLSNSSNLPLSAKQGKLLDAKFGGLSFVKMSKSAYDALATKDENTIYFTFEE